MKRHGFPVRVYYEDTDAGGVAYHATYLRWAERARTEAMREAGAPHSDLVTQHGLSFMVRRVEMEYLRPARLDDLLTVMTCALHVRAASAEIRQSFVRDGEALAEAAILLACVRLADGRPGRIPDRWRRALAAELGDELGGPSG